MKKYALAYIGHSDQQCVFNLEEHQVNSLDMHNDQVVVIEQHHVPHMTYARLRNGIMEKVGHPVKMVMSPFGRHYWTRAGSY